SNGNGPGREVWSEDQLGKAESDSDGRFEFTLASWKGPHLRVEADGYSLALVIPLAGHDTPGTAQAILLDAEARIRAHVLDPAGGAISEAKVVLTCEAYLLHRLHDFSLSLDIPDPEWVGISDEQGRCVIEEVPPGVQLKVRVNLRGQPLFKDDHALM